MKREMTPHQQMEELDEQGDDYYLEDVRLTNGTCYGRLEVCRHSEAWLYCADEAGTYTWINLAQVISLVLR